MQFFLYSCKQAHRMISEGLDRPLRLSERARLKMHLSICNACTNFNGQMQFYAKRCTVFHKTLTRRINHPQSLNNDEHLPTLSDSIRLCGSGQHRPAMLVYGFTRTRRLSFTRG